MDKTVKTDRKLEYRKKVAVAFTELTHSLALKSAKERFDKLIASEHGAVLVPLLHAEDLYLTIKEVGLSDALELVRLASPDQFRAFVDLDAWKRDSFLPSVLLSWIRAAGTDEKEERFRGKLRHLDIEVLKLALRSTVIVHEVAEGQDPYIEGTAFRSPEGKYVLDITVEGADYLGIKRLLDELYAEDPFKAARLLEAIRWEVPSELEETAFRWRSARMEDLGFPALSEALSYYSYIDPNKELVVLESEPWVPKGRFLSRWEPGNLFLDQVWQTISFSKRLIVEQQMLLLLNAVMVAESIDSGDSAQVRRAVSSARDTLSLGLEHVSGRDVLHGAQLLYTCAIKRLFQIGVSLGLKMKFRADRLMRTGKISLHKTSAATLLDSPLAEVMAALRRKKPLFPEVLDHEDALDKKRPFRQLEDLARVEAALENAEKIAAAMEFWGFSSERFAEVIIASEGSLNSGEITFSKLFLTALARVAVGEKFDFVPFPLSKSSQFTTVALETDSPEGIKLSRLLESLAENHCPAKEGNSWQREWVRKSLQKFIEKVRAYYAAHHSGEKLLPQVLIVDEKN